MSPRDERKLKGAEVTLCSYQDFRVFIKEVSMNKLIVLSVVLIILIACGASEKTFKTFQNPAEVIKALDKHNVTKCNDLDAEPFLANESVICFIELGGGELKDVMFNISTYADIKQIDLFKDKCKKNDVRVFPDCSKTLEYTFYHGNVMMSAFEMYLGGTNKASTIGYEMRPVSEVYIDTILEDLAD